MAIGIGIAALFSGLFCTSEAAAIDYATRGDMADCVEVGAPSLKLMAQAVVFKNDVVKVVRMGTITDPVVNIWLVLPAQTKVTGEAP